MEVSCVVETVVVREVTIVVAGFAEEVITDVVTCSDVVYSVVTGLSLIITTALSFSELLFTISETQANAAIIVADIAVIIFNLSAKASPHADYFDDFFLFIFLLFMKGISIATPAAISAPAARSFGR